jgi:hypothetical protein
MADWVSYAFLLKFALAGLCVLAVLAFLGVRWWLKPFLEAHAAKLATKEDVGKVLEQATETARAVESVKSEIENGRWERQTLATLKREAYLNLLNVIGELHSALTQFMCLYRTQPQGDSDPEHQRLWEERSKAVDSIVTESLKRFICASGPVQLVCSSEASETIARHTEAIGELPLGTPDVIQQRIELYTNLHHRLVSIAKKDLGFPN